MNLSKKLGHVCESLDNSMLSKFSEEAKKHLFTANDKTSEAETLLLSSEAAEISDTITVSSKYQDDLHKVADIIEKDLEIKFSQSYIKDYVALVLNEFVLKDTSSTDEDDAQALNHMMKNLKSNPIGFEAIVSVNFLNDETDSLEGSIDLLIQGSGKVKDFNYDEKKDELNVTDFSITKIDNFNLN